VAGSPLADTFHAASISSYCCGQLLLPTTCGWTRRPLAVGVADARRRATQRHTGLVFVPPLDKTLLPVPALPSTRAAFHRRCCRADLFLVSAFSCELCPFACMTVLPILPSRAATTLSALAAHMRLREHPNWLLYARYYEAILAANNKASPPLLLPLYSHFRVTT